VAKEHLKPKEMTMVVVGKPEDFGRSVATLGIPVTSIDLTIPEPKAEAAPATPESLARGKQLLQRAQQAVGGVEKLEAVKDATEVVDFQMDAASGGMKVKQTNRWIAPMQFRQDSEMPIGKISAYSDGAGGWIRTPQGTIPLGPAQRKQVQG